MNSVLTSFATLNHRHKIYEKLLIFCTLMKLETAGSLVIVSTGQGAVHGPFTLYVNERYDNPNSKAAASRALRVLLRVVDAFGINLAARALDGLCLLEGEKKALVQLAHYSIESIETMTDKKVRTIALAQARVDVSKIKNAVAPNTAAKQLVQIADFLAWYHRKVLEPRMPLSSDITEALRRQFELCAQELARAVASTKSAHPHKIRSVPSQLFLEIYSIAFLRATDLFRTKGGREGGNLKRDRAMILLAAEGMRPGAIGNIALADFKWPSGSERGYIVIKDNTARRINEVTTATPKQKGTGSRQNYNSEMTMSIWPTTAQAIQEYIAVEREAVARRTLTNRSRGFLFLAEHGGPITDRGTIGTVFRRAGSGLQRLGLLAKDPKDPYLEGEQYNFSAYLLRHSSASLFYSSKTREMKGEVVEDLMKMRFGWARESGMPRLYAQRALSDAASLTVDDFVDSLMAASRERRRTSDGGS
ncbi:hypothetical protein [Variovorax sp. DAIF25]|uniref:hypothetical protein n=1 Tax=Variovorax sp. DAIF25 TaxID=3080983 RepID=UPI003D6A8BA5